MDTLYQELSRQKLNYDDQDVDVQCNGLLVHHNQIALSDILGNAYNKHFR